jgi:hypothetical protein
MDGRKRSRQHLSVKNSFINNILSIALATKNKNIMNSILNNKKIRIFSLVMVLASVIAVGIFIQSCNDEEFYGSSSAENYTEADFLVVSSEFQVFQRDIENFAEDLRANYTNLSISDRNEFDEILKKIAAVDIEDTEDLYNQMNSIIKIDLKARLTEIRENSLEIRNSVERKNVSRKDLIVAIKRNSIIQKKPFIRLKNGAEQDGDNQACRDACSVAYVGAALICLTLPPPADIGCGLIATAVYISCLEAC